MASLSDEPIRGKAKRLPGKLILGSHFLFALPVCVVFKTTPTETETLSRLEILETRPRLYISSYIITVITVLAES